MYLARFGDSSHFANEWSFLPQHVNLLVDPIFTFSRKFNVEGQHKRCQKQPHFMPGEALGSRQHTSIVRKEIII